MAATAVALSGHRSSAQPPEVDPPAAPASKPPPLSEAAPPTPSILAVANTQPTRGPLRVHPLNPRYFADTQGNAVYLTGAHTWPILVDQGLADPPTPFDFDGYIESLARRGQNFIRSWVWETAVCDLVDEENGRTMRYYAAQHPWLRAGPGLALDGKPKFDLRQFNDEYFDRLRNRVQAAGRRGIYVSIMFFEGWSMQHGRGAYEGHPFHPSNNVNGIRGDLDGDGNALEIFTLDNPATFAVQKAYVRKVVETVNDLDNVLYEVSNETLRTSTEWQFRLIRFVREQEKRTGIAHPIGMTYQYKGGVNKTLFDSPADWISPNDKGGYRDDPPPTDGRKVILNDTDHLWGIGGTPDWVWKSFLRGYNVLFMDPYDGLTFGPGDPAKWEPIREALGQTRAWSERIDLATMTPQPALASTGYCLASLSEEPALLVYAPTSEAVKIDLREIDRPLNAEWFDPASGQVTPLPVAPGADWLELAPPTQGPWLIHLRA